MPKKYEAIQAIELKEKSSFYHHPELPELTHLDDPAQNVLVDFHLSRPATVSKETKITDALLEMKASNVHMLLVVDEQDGVLGIISSEAIHGERPYQVMREKDIKHSDITVCMLMIPREKLLCVSDESIRHAKVAHIIETLKVAKRHYCLVVSEDESGQHSVVGYFSASQISKTLGTADVTSDRLVADSVLELQQLLRNME